MHAIGHRFLAAVAALLALVAAGALTATDAGAAAVVTGNIRDATAQFFITGPNGEFYNDLIGDRTFGTENFSGGAGANRANPLGLGASGNYGARNLQNVYLPGDPGLGGAFTGIAVPNIAANSRGGQTDAALHSEINGVARVIVFFTLDVPTRWSWSASTVNGTSAGTGSADYFFGIIEDTSQVVPYTYEEALSGTFDQAVSAGGILPAGQWELALVLSARMTFDRTTGSGDHFVFLEDGLFRLTALPEPASVVLAGIGLLGLGALRRRCND